MTEPSSSARPKVQRLGIHWIGEDEPEWIPCTIVSDPYPDPRGSGQMVVNVEDADGSYAPAVPVSEIRDA